MPTYQYECEACDHEFETFQGMNDAKLKKCPECGKLKLTRLIGSGAGIIFKGSGFYETDYKKKGSSSSSSSESKSEKKSDSSTSSKGGDKKFSTKKSKKD